MSLSELPEPGALSDQELDRLLAELTERERVLSTRRSKLFDRLEFLRASADDTQSASDQIAKVAEDERRISEERLAVHRLIDALRAERAGRGTAQP